MTLHKFDDMMIFKRGGYMNIHERIKELRLSYGLSQKELAEELNKIEIGKDDPKIFTQTISYWENGRDPSLNGIKKLARFFNCSVDFLLDESDIKNWSEFNLLSNFENKSLEQFTNYLKTHFEEEIAMAIMDSFSNLMIIFTVLPILEENESISWKTEITDTINLIAYLLNFSRSIRGFQEDFIRFQETINEPEDAFPTEMSLNHIIKKYMELENRTNDLIQRILNDSLKYSGTIAVDLFLTEKELQKRKEAQLEYLKNNDPEIYKILTRFDSSSDLLDEKLLKPIYDPEDPDVWQKEREARIKESNLKFRNSI